MKRGKEGKKEGASVENPADEPGNNQTGCSRKTQFCKAQTEGLFPVAAAMGM